MTNEELCIEFQQTRSNILFEYFVKRNEGLIFKRYNSVAASQERFGITRDEILELGKVAMYRTMMAFKKDGGAKFTTFYTYFALDELKDWYYSLNRIHIPYHIMANYSKFLEYKEKHPEFVYDLASLDAPLQQDEDSGIIGDMVASSFDLEQIIIDKELSIKLNEICKKYLKPSKYRCISLFFGLDGNEPKTLQRIGDEYGLTRETIRQHILRGLKKIKPYVKKMLED